MKREKRKKKTLFQGVSSTTPFYAERITPLSQMHISCFCINWMLLGWWFSHCQLSPRHRPPCWTWTSRFTHDPYISTQWVLFWWLCLSLLCPPSSERENVSSLYLCSLLLFTAELPPPCYFDLRSYCDSLTNTKSVLAQAESKNSISKSHYINSYLLGYTY